VTDSNAIFDAINPVQARLAINFQANLKLFMDAFRCVIPVVKSPKDYQAFRISPHDTNRLAIVFDTATANIS